MPGWTIETLPKGWTASHAVTTDGDEWYTVSAQKDGEALAVSPQLRPADPGFQASLDAFVDGNYVAAAPGAADLVLGALASLNPATATVSDVVNAVKGALASSGALPLNAQAQQVSGPIAAG